jgi:leucyl aminopeptidase (aminopeptidase T)
MIQQIDKASYVEILGYQGNATKLTIQLPKIPDPKTQTNFLNGGATLNIPAGELFTTPKLSGSSGTLHVKEIFLKGNKYHNLRLEFVDGLITDYNCDNFSETEDNKVFIKQNLLNNHQTLPIGEFAIGTNTTAFKIMKKHKLESVLPILITEKTGPHIAIGDPCFARSEDHPVYNLLDNKEVIARENEITSDRKTYYNCHTDITIPYDEIKYLRAISENGNVIEIIKDGKFVLAGTEILNLDYLK